MIRITGIELPQVSPACLLGLDSQGVLVAFFWLECSFCGTFCKSWCTIQTFHQLFSLHYQMEVLTAPLVPLESMSIDQITYLVPLVEQAE
jgi:hypothetical protein